MNKRSAIALAKKALEKLRKDVAFNANLYSRGLVKSFRTEEDHKKYVNISDAIEVLKTL